MLTVNVNNSFKYRSARFWRFVLNVFIDFGGIRSSTAIASPF